eukprot:894080-Amphidinium_carterae.1
MVKRQIFDRWFLVSHTTSALGGSYQVEPPHPDMDSYGAPHNELDFLRSASNKKCHVSVGPHLANLSMVARTDKPSKTCCPQHLQ